MKQKGLAAAIAVGVLAIGIPVLSTATAAGSNQGGDTISLVEHPITDTIVNVAQPGDRVGNILPFANPIFNDTDKKRVASDQGYCIRVKVGVAWECTWTNFLQGGQIVVQGPYFDTRDSDLAITGGTGIYQGATGTMHLHAISGGKEYRFVFHVQ